MPFQPPVSPVLRADVLIPSSQVLTIFTTPVTLVPAPGPGLAILIVNGVVNYTYKGTAYTDHTGNLVMFTGSLGLLQAATAGFWDQTVSKQMTFAQGGTVQSTSGWANQPITLQQSVANPTGGNGTLLASVFYMVTAAS